MRWARHVTCMGEMRNTQLKLENLKGRHHLGDLGIDRKIILKEMKNYSVRMWNGFI